MKIDTKIWLIPVFIGILFSGCIQEELEWTVKDILDRPELYQGRNITIEGEYRGWETGCAPTGPPATRNDWQIKDETGCIYVTGIFPELDPYHDIGTRIEVTGMIKVGGVETPYIEALEIKILSGNETTEPGGIVDIFTEPDKDIIPPNLPD